MEITDIDCKYLVGIDFGDGETTASCIDLDRLDPKHPQVMPLRIVNLNDGEDSIKVESCIYKDADGEWEFATDPEHFYTGSARSYFKERIQVLERKENAKKKEAFIAFIELVFSRILLNNSFLTFDKETKAKNFYLAVACPSRWGKDPCTGGDDSYTINRYQTFLQQYLPIDALIKESDAAFFHFLFDKEFQGEQGKYLVIDYGSSTIDFTYYDLSNGKKEIECDGTPGRDCGASKVEQRILDYIEQNDPDCQKAESMIESWLNKYGDKIEWENALLHVIKKHKELYYGNRRKKLGQMKVEMRDIYDPSLENTAGLYFFNNIELSRETIENDCLKDYKALVHDELLRIGGKWNPGHIIITGGASRMPWVQPMVESVFKTKNPNVKVNTDNKTPSYVVSNGIVKYLLRYRGFLERFYPIMEDFLSGYYVSREFIIPKVNEALTKSIVPLLSKQISSACDRYVRNDSNSESETSYNAFAAIIDQCGRSFFSTISSQQMAVINETIGANIEKYLLPVIEITIRDVFKENFILNLDFPLTINHLECIDRESVLTLGGTLVVKKQKSWFESMSSPRGHYERVDMANKILKYYQSEEFIIVESDINNVLSDVRSAVKKCFESAMKQIPFTIY